MQSVNNQEMTETHIVSGFMRIISRFEVLHIIHATQLSLVICYNLNNKKQYIIC